MNRKGTDFVVKVRDLGCERWKRRRRRRRRRKRRRFQNKAQTSGYGSSAKDGKEEEEGGEGGRGGGFRTRHRLVAVSYTHLTLPTTAEV